MSGLADRAAEAILDENLDALVGAVDSAMPGARVRVYVDPAAQTVQLGVVVAYRADTSLAIDLLAQGGPDLLVATTLDAARELRRTVETIGIEAAKGLLEHRLGTQ